MALTLTLVGPTILCGLEVVHMQPFRQELLAMLKHVQVDTGTPATEWKSFGISAHGITIA